MLLYSAGWMSADNDMEASRGDLVLGNGNKCVYNYEKSTRVFI